MRSRRKCYESTWRTSFITLQAGPVFFERGVLDALCALDQITPLNEGELNMWLSNYQYFPKVFVLPPWRAIYENDAERDQTLEHAEWVNRIAQGWYRRCGYQRQRVGDELLRNFGPIRTQPACRHPMTGRTPVS
jgi:predicted ATPase